MIRAWKISTSDRNQGGPAQAPTERTDDGEVAPFNFSGAIPVVLTGSATLVPVSPPRGFSFAPEEFQARLNADATQILIGIHDRKGKRRAFVQNVDGSDLTQGDKDKSAGVEYSGDLSHASFRP